MPTRFEPVNCPVCKHVFDSASNLHGEEDAMPSAGDICVCINCVRILIFVDDKCHLRAATKEDILRLSTSEKYSLFSLLMAAEVTNQIYSRRN